MKKTLTTVLLLIFSIFSVACSGNVTNEKTNSTTKQGIPTTTDATSLQIDEANAANKDISLNLSDIDWKVTEGLINGKNTAVLSYTNNSDFTITSVTMKFEQKENLTESDLSVFDEHKALFEMSEEEVRDIHITACNAYFTESGQTSDEAPCSLVGSFNYCHNMEEYNLMEPVEISVSYIYNNKKYGIYHNYKSEETTGLSSEGVEIYEWSESELAQAVPKPEYEVVEINGDYDETYSFTIYNASEEDYNSYKEKCIEAGFAQDAVTDEVFTYEAKNSSGYVLEIDYKPFNKYNSPCRISVTVKK